jgi:hypothetical protein
MATTVARKRNQGKTAFVREVLKNNPYANAEAVVAHWNAEGHEGTISQTLVNKQRSVMGLAGNLRGRRRRRTAKAAAAKRPYTGKKRGRKPGSALAAGGAGTSNGRSAEAPRGRLGGRHNQLVALEADIDQLLFKVMHLGELPELEASLRKTRRLLYDALTGGRA